MTHLTPDHLLNHLLDQHALSQEHLSHLANCEICQAQLASLATLTGELTVARSADVDDQILARYDALFDQVVQPPTLLQRMASLLRGELLWDSRLQPGLQGVRAAGQPTTYRLLYATEVAEIELLVEPTGPDRRLEGDLLPLDTGGLELPALVQMVRNTDLSLVAEQEITAQGRFSLENILPAAYSLTLTPRLGPALTIPEIEIT